MRSRSRTPKRAKFDRANADWRNDLLHEIGQCQLPDCPGAFPRHPTLHEISCGTAGRKLSLSERLACLVACAYCNQHRLTDYKIWPVARQAALQCLLVADFASPQEVLDVINFCRGRAKTAIEWKDVAKYLEVAT